MKNYEATCLFDSSLGDEKIDSIVAKFENKIKSSKGELVRTDKWGKKKLAYTLPNNKKVKEANYVMLEFKGEPATLNALEDSIKYEEGIVRYRIICAKPHRTIPDSKSGESVIEAGEKVEVNPDILISADKGEKAEDGQSQ